MGSIEASLWRRLERIRHCHMQIDESGAISPDFDHFSSSSGVSKILHRLHEEIAELAVLAAGQILQREVKETDYTELVDRVIEEAKTAKWENQ